MKFILILVCSVFIFSGCQKKEKSDLVTVTFTMPDLSGHGTQNLYQRAASAPTTINEVNCFAVMVSAPEPMFNRTSCPVVDANSVQIAAPKKTGLVVGLVPSGKQISLSVPGGIQRQFTLLGVKANPLTVCLDFNNPNISQDYTSQLFIVGESAQVDLQPGTSVNVPIKLPASSTAITNSSPRIGECTGPDSPSSRGRILPTRAEVVKEQFPYNIISYSSCNSVNLAFVDDMGRTGPTIVSQNLILERAEVYSNGTVGLFTSFAMFTNSNCTGTLTTEFNVPINSRNIPIFFNSTAAASATGFKFRVRPGTTSPVSLYPEFITNTFPIAPTGTAAIEVFGARRIIPDMCYNMVGNFKTTNLTAISGTAYIPSYPDIESKLFPEKFCTNASIASGTTYAVTPDLKFDFSMRFTSTAFTSTFFSLLPTVATSNTIASKYIVQVVGGSYDPTFIRPEIPPFLPANTTGCFGPFQSLVENERGAALVTDGTIAMSFIGGHPDVAIFNNNLCNQNYASSFGSDYRRIFYVGVSTTAVAANSTYSLRAQGQIDHPSAPGNSLYTVSLTTIVNLNFK